MCMKNLAPLLSVQHCLVQMFLMVLCRWLQKAAVHSVPVNIFGRDGCVGPPNSSHTYIYVHFVLHISKLAVINWHIHFLLLLTNTCQLSHNFCTSLHLLLKARNQMFYKSTPDQICCCFVLVKGNCISVQEPETSEYSEQIQRATYRKQFMDKSCIYGMRMSDKDI